MKTEVILTIIICLTLLGMVISMSSCVARETEATEKKKQTYSPLERCIEACPVYWKKDEGCIQECFELEKVKLQYDETPR